MMKGNSLKEIPDKLLPVLVQSGLNTSIVAGELYYFPVTDSTNRMAKEYALSGVSDGTVVIAEKQVSGKGRMNRSWVSPAYSSILCSIIFYPCISTSSVFKLTMLASIAVVVAIHKACGIQSRIKWPNDVYIKNKKVCGILSEFSSDQDTVQYAVIGIGINVNFDVALLPEIRETATSLNQETGQRVSRLKVMKTLLKEIDLRYHDLLHTNKRDLKKEWEHCSMVLNRHVKIISGHKVTSGLAKRINEEGHLIIIDSLGKEKEILCGDVSLSL